MVSTFKKGTKKGKDKKKNSTLAETTNGMDDNRERETTKRKPVPRRENRRTHDAEPTSNALSGKKTKKPKPNLKKSTRNNKTIKNSETTNEVKKQESTTFLAKMGLVANKPDNCRTPSPNNDQPVNEDDLKTVKQPGAVSPHANVLNNEPTSVKAKDPKAQPAVPALNDGSLKGNSATVPNITTLSQSEKWAAEATARDWLEKVDFSKTKLEFEKLQMMTVNVDTECKKWKDNIKLSQSDHYPALDSNLVAFEKVFVNISHVEVPLQRNLLIGQIPVTGNEEAFWKVVFGKCVTSMHVIFDQEPIHFFPVRSGDHIYHKTMFVHNRRVESVNEDVHRFSIEVLPEGCSNSIICNVTVVKNWKMGSVHTKQAVVIKEAIELINFTGNKAKDESALVLSTHGAGRAVYFVALSVAVYKLDLKSEPSIFDIVKSLRAQRPKAIESLTQYASLYISMFYYIKRKSSKMGDDKKVASDPHNPLCIRSVQLTNIFTNALIAEANAACSSTTTMLTK